MEEMNEATVLGVHEKVVLSKFDGDTTHVDAEVERITVDNGLVVSHDVIEKGEVVGSVPNSEILGKDIGTLMVPQPAEEVN